MRCKIRHWSSKSLNMFNMPISHFSRLLSLWWLPYTERQANVYQQQKLLYFCFYPRLSLGLSVLAPAAWSRRRPSNRPLQPPLRQPRALMTARRPDILHVGCQLSCIGLVDAEMMRLFSLAIIKGSIACYSRWRLIQLNIRETPHAALEPPLIVVVGKRALCVFWFVRGRSRLIGKMINWLVHFSDYLDFLYPSFCRSITGEACCHHRSRNSFSQIISSSNRVHTARGAEMRFVSLITLFFQDKKYRYSKRNSWVTPKNCSSQYTLQRKLIWLIENSLL